MAAKIEFSDFTSSGLKRATSELNVFTCATLCLRENSEATWEATQTVRHV